MVAPVTDDDPYNLQRFVDAQRPLYQIVLAELRQGRKESHWMWFFFPQLRGLGTSARSSRFGVSGLDEARAYLAHPGLGARLNQCCELLLKIQGRSAREIFGSTDERKLHSCVTLFAIVASPHSVFERVLEVYFNGEPDSETHRLLGAPRLEEPRNT